MPYKSQNWTTKDYFDPEPGWNAGLRIRALNQQQDAQQQGMEMRQAENAAQAQQNAEAMRMRQVEMMSRMDVEPVMGPNGQIDWGATKVQDTQFKTMNARAATLGQEHALTPPTSLNQVDNELMQMDSYKQARVKTLTSMRMADDRFKANLEQEKFRQEGRLELEREQQRRQQAAGRQGTVSGDDPDNPGQRISFPIGADEARQRLQGQPAPATPDKFEEAYDRIQRAEGAGEKLDFDVDAQGFPIVSGSAGWGFHDAKPSKPESYDALRKKIDVMKKKNTNGGGVPMQSGGQQNAPRRLVYPSGQR